MKKLNIKTVWKIIENCQDRSKCLRVKTTMHSQKKVFKCLMQLRYSHMVEILEQSAKQDRLSFKHEKS